MNQTHLLGTHFPASFQSDFTQYPHLKKINSRRLEDEPENPLSISSSYRKSFPKKRPYNKKNKSPNHNHGRWTIDEENLYLQFVTEFALKNPDWLDKGSGQKRIFYFKAMSDFIGTRTPEQCRSKDQKMQDRSDSLAPSRYPPETHQTPMNMIQGVNTMISQGEFNDQNRNSYPEKFQEGRANEEASVSSYDTSIYNIDRFFNFGQKEVCHGGSKYDFDDHANYY